MSFNTLATSVAAAALLLTPALADSWPDLPIGIKNGFAAQIGQSVYAGLGSAEQRVYRLDLADLAAGWTEVEPFAGPAPNQPATAVADGKLYIFSGSGKMTPESEAPVIFDTAYRYDPESDSWAKLETTIPAGLLGASAAALSDGKIAIFGGYNKERFDTYLSDITAIDKEKDPVAWEETVQGFMGMKPEDYAWNDLVLIFDPATNNWSDKGRNPDLPNTGAVLVATEHDSFVLANGEVKPGLRTDAVKRVDLSGGEAVWEALPPLPEGTYGGRQEGVAGAYAGLIDDTLVVAGGANFPGARDAADAGHWFAHEGLSKTWTSDIFLLQNNTWSLVGALPEGLAYGSSVTLPNGILLIGGEDKSGAARADVTLLTLENDAVALHP